MSYYNQKTIMIINNIPNINVGKKLYIIIKYFTFISILYFLSINSINAQTKDGKLGQILINNSYSVITDDNTEDTATLKNIISIAVLSYGDSDFSDKRWQTLISYLNDKLHEYQFQVITVHPNQLDRLIKHGNIDFFISNPVEAIQYKSQFGSSEILTAWPIIFKDPSKAVGSTAIAKKDLNFTDWKDIEKYRVVSTSPRAYGGFLILNYELARQGMDLLKSDNMRFVNTPQEKLVDLVMQDKADIAIIPTCILEDDIAKSGIDISKLQVLTLEHSYKNFLQNNQISKSQSTGYENDDNSPCQHTTDLYPSYVLSKLKTTDNELSIRLVNVLLNNKARFTDHQQQIVIWTPPVDNSSVYKLLNQLQLGPYLISWAAISKKIAPISFWILLFLFIGYLHHLRIKRLVTKRTAALLQEKNQHFETQKELMTQQQQFFKAQRVLLTGEMASGIAHELNQPLASIRYLAQGCQYRITNFLRSNQTEEVTQRSLNEELNQALEKLTEQVDRAQATIQRIRTFCQKPSERKVINLKDIIVELLQFMNIDIKKHNVIMQCQLEYDAWIDADAILLQQVIVNLVRNAIDAMIARDDKITPELLITLSTSEKKAYLTITDNGVGVPKEKLERLFFPFETSKKDGLGLGMVICKRIITEHNGSIWAESNETNGLTIYVILPLAAD